MWVEDMRTSKIKYKIMKILINVYFLFSDDMHT